MVGMAARIDAVAVRGGAGQGRTDQNRLVAAVDFADGHSPDLCVLNLVRSVKNVAPIVISQVLNVALFFGWLSSRLPGFNLWEDRHVIFGSSVL